MLLRPLFFTSWLIDDQLADDGLTARGPIMISSASSKPAIAAAFQLARRQEVELVGLSLGAQHKLCRGPEDLRPGRPLRPIDEPPERSPATFVDVAGDKSSAPRRRLASREEPTSPTVCRIEISSLGGVRCRCRNLPGPSPASFSAPDRVVEALECDRGESAWRRRSPRLRTPSAESIEDSHEVGGSISSFDALHSSCLAVLEGRMEAQRRHVTSL